MRTFHADVLFNDKYMTECYSPQFQVYNMGHLTLVSEQYFPFAKAVMETIAGSLTTDDIWREGKKHLQSARDRVAEQEDTLKQVFFECGRGEFAGVSKSTKVVIMKKMIDKATNARFGMEEKHFNSQTVKRGGSTNCQSATFRGEMSVKVKGSEVDKYLAEAIDE